MAELTITGDVFNSAEITDILLINPTKYWGKGDVKPHSAGYREYTLWKFDTDYIESLNIETQTTVILNLFKPKIQILKSLAESKKLEYGCSIVIKIRNNQVPSMTFNQDFINFIYEIGAVVDIDLYILEQ